MHFRVMTVFLLLYQPSSAVMLHVPGAFLFTVYRERSTEKMIQEMKNGKIQVYLPQA